MRKVSSQTFARRWRARVHGTREGELSDLIFGANPCASEAAGKQFTQWKYLLAKEASVCYFLSRVHMCLEARGHVSDSNK